MLEWESGNLSKRKFLLRFTRLWADPSNRPGHWTLHHDQAWWQIQKHSTSYLAATPLQLVQTDCLCMYFTWHLHVSRAYCVYFRPVPTEGWLVESWLVPICKLVSFGQFKERICIMLCVFIRIKKDWQCVCVCACECVCEQDEWLWIREICTAVVDT